MAPAPTLDVHPVNGPPAGEPSAGQKSQKQMTKAERRELQEKQRAAKAAKAAANAPNGKLGGKAAKELSALAGAPSKKTGRPSDAASKPPPPGLVKAAQAKAGQASLADQSARNQARGLLIFSHFGLPKPVSAAKGDIHPAIARLALQFSTFKITGANARCIATLTAFKTVIQDYVTPQNNTLSRHLMTYLSPQISHLVAARPMSITMGNAIRQLKLDISGSDIDLPEQDAKDVLFRKIDTYIRERIIIADQVIQETAGNKIKDGDIVLTYARSSVVEKVLLEAHASGREFSVIVVDSRPMLEGKRLLAVLSEAGIQCTYLLLPALGSVISEVSVVLVGAHSIHTNGAVYSRAGTALVAMMAKRHSVPVVVCCETYKFSENIQLDSFTKNELAPLGDLFSSFPNNKPREYLTLENQPHLEILNPLYDLTPPSCITAVVTEVGVIPPNAISSIPVALGRL
ncbi:eukaryotic translation initiation factor 2B delta subunit [Dichomitus squalens]|uniref:Translation initiation factor eIF2B subunit delta n=1 Tax=Dichomitus squalens TaxID=114155 RepID=A0A4Q9MZ16_9APHY|nr:eukaryotic translation initiation factor 2B delta subunit [Dichomitus squalens]TBU44787.1 eukaryotic translation initiation factor 2B delta subunit [Dichomitus squalens]TBU64202.1 eukaryotic translation initiation factor 2B delta subunit [Dichomitus squalens]